jgi:hypoxanthine phosphoribosyltransferase
VNKQYIDANELLQESFYLASSIYSSGYRPNLIVGVWRGGAPIAIAVHEYFSYMGWEADHIAIRALSYTGINERVKEVDITGLEYIVNQGNDDHQILIVDDVFDTGNSCTAIINSLETMCGIPVSRRIKIACPWYKPKNNQTQIEPDFYLHETAQWLVFPHELKGLTIQEIHQEKNIPDKIFT